jgi:cytidyltransferase-like protein
VILDFSDLQRHRGRLAMVGGAFDPLHHGHIEYFRQARALGKPLLCCIAPDHYVATKHPPLLPAAQRALVVDALSDIDYTLISRSDTETVLRELRPSYFIKGRDWQGRLPVHEQRACAAHGTEIVFLDTLLDSSTTLLERYRLEPPDRERAVNAFEALVGSLRTIECSFDIAGCAGGGRRDRRAGYPPRAASEEPPHEVVQKLFRPGRVLDVGWGRGTLLSALKQHGVMVEAVDLSATRRDVAPHEARPNIRLGTRSDAALVAEDGYDLVICRDVLEHLSVLQIYGLVCGLCRSSSRYICVAADFHPDPTGLLDVVTQLDVGGSHITLVNRNLLRVLFVLEGFRRREDLETRIDWNGRGGMLVYEKPGRRRMAGSRA